MRIVLAEPSHDEALRRLARSLPMPGWIRVAYAREPSYLRALAIQGRHNETIVAEDGDRVYAAGCRSIRPMYIDGSPRDFGYLHGLRSLPEAKRAGILARGYRFLRALHADGRVPAYVTTVVEDNEQARTLLTSRRAGLPAYLDWGRYFTYAVFLRRGHPRRIPAGMAVVSGDQVPLDRLVAFLAAEGSRRQFCPVVEAADFGRDTLTGLRPSDFLVAMRGGRIVGTVACWDQAAFRQQVVCGYERGVGFLRPAINGLLGRFGYGSLPPPGHTLRMFHAAFVRAEQDDARILARLLDAVCASRADGRHDFFAVGFHERDPLRAAVRRLRAFRYVSRLYVVCWEDGLDFCQSLHRERVPYLEPGML